MSGVIHASEVRVGVFPSVDPMEHLDEDWAIPCEIGPKLDNCGGKPAEFILWLTACDCSARTSRPFLSCKGCLDAILGDELNISCHRCGFAYLPASTALRLIEPLNWRTT